MLDEDLARQAGRERDDSPGNPLSNNISQNREPTEFRYCGRCLTKTDQTRHISATWNAFFGPEGGLLSTAIAIGVILATGCIGILFLSFLSPLIVMLCFAVGQLIYPQVWTRCSRCRTLNQDFALTAKLNLIRGWGITSVCIAFYLILVLALTTGPQKPQNDVVGALLGGLILIGVPLIPGVVWIISGKKARKSAQRQEGLGGPPLFDQSVSFADFDPESSSEN